jgi:transposase
MIVCDNLIMAKGYRPVPRNQPFLLPPDMREWLPADHPVHLVIEVVDHHLDTSAVHATRRAGRAGAAGYDPDMLTALLVWAYANRVTSSRRIEQLCRTDIAFKLIGAGQVPDHVTIARFRAGLGPAAAELFDQVLILCARLGMGRVGVITLDGTKVKASASKSANRSEERLRELAAQIAAEHAATDAAEDALFGPGTRGDELPPELADPRSRDERIAAALAGLQADREAAERERQDKAQDYLAGPPGLGKPPAEARLAAAERRLARATAGQQALADAWHARQAASIAAGKGQLPGTVPAPPEQSGKVARARAALAKAQAAAGAEPKPAAGRSPQRNITDPHSRLQPVRGGGFIQGYNPQNVTSADGLIIATELTADQNDAPWFEPLLTRAQRAAALIAAARGSDADDRIGLILADAGYLSDHNLQLPGPDRLIATGKRRDIDKLAKHASAAGQAGYAWHSPAIAAMAARLASDDGHAAYRHRGHIAETPHGDLKHNKGFRQFSVRGKPRVTAEWMLITTVTNLFKAISSGHLTTAALASITATPA